MNALILAAAVTALHGPPPADAKIEAPSPLPRAHACGPETVTTANPAAPIRAQKLTELPDANEVRLVLRRVDGCDYQEVTRFKVSEPGPYHAEGVLVPSGGAVQPARPTGEGR